MWLLLLIACRTDPPQPSGEMPAPSTGDTASVAAATASTGDTAWTFGTPVVVFSATRAGVPGLFVADAQGHARRVADGDFTQIVPSPDGAHVAAVTGGDLELWSLDAVRIATVAGGEPTSWRDDGALLAYEVDRPTRQVGVVDVATGTPRTVTADTGPLRVAWQPDGPLLGLFHGDPGQLDVVDVDAGTWTQVTDSGRRPFANEWSWSPDGAWLAYVDRDDDSGTAQQVQVVRPDATDRHPLAVSTLPRGGYAQEARWSADGRWVAWMDLLDDEARSELYVAAPDVDGHRRVSLAEPTTDHGNVLDLAWSSGDALAYMGEQSVEQRMDLYITDPAGGNVRHVASPLAPGVYRPDAMHWFGDHVAFEAYEGATDIRTLFVSDTSGAPALQISDDFAINGAVSGVATTATHVAWRDGGGLHVWDGSRRTVTTDTLRRSREGTWLQWSPAGDALVFLLSDGSLVLAGLDGTMTELAGSTFDEVFDAVVLP